MNTRLNYSIPTQDISSLSFKYSRADGSHDVAPVSLLPDGTLVGYSHKNEAGWTVLDGKIALLNRDGIASTVFDECESVNGKLVFKGRYLLRPELGIVHHLEQIDWTFQDRARHPKLTLKMLEADIERYGWSIGDHTYGVPNVMEKRYANLTIGKFCSIAAGVLIALGNHRIDGVTSYPFATLAKHWPSLKGLSIEDHSSKGDISIGNDVWIGFGATILPGVTIGDGAVIAARCVVTKDVPPYAVCGGNPGKILKFRHSDEDIKSLSMISWWDWSDEVLNDRLPLMMSDMNGFIAKYKPVP